jgi:hypothetical protein
LARVAPLLAVRLAPDRAVPLSAPPRHPTLPRSSSACPRARACRFAAPCMCTHTSDAGHAAGRAPRARS